MHTNRTKDIYFLSICFIDDIKKYQEKVLDLTTFFCLVAGDSSDNHLQLTSSKMDNYALLYLGVQVFPYPSTSL